MNKKNFLKTIFLTCLILVLAFVIENVSSINQSTEEETFNVSTKNIVVQETHERNTRIPSSISYDKDGYVGTLKRHARPDYTDNSANKVTYTYSGVAYKSESDIRK